MNEYLRISMIIAIVIYFIFLFIMLKKNSLNLKYTLLWLLTGIVMLIVIIFPDLLAVPLRNIGIIEWTNGIFALILLFIIIICIAITSIVSKMNDMNRKLTQQCAIYEKRIRELEKKINAKENV